MAAWQQEGRRLEVWEVWEVCRISLAAREWMRQLNSTAKSSSKELDTGAAAAAAVAIRLLIADGARRLSFQQFNEFLANIKKLNSHLQTRDETLTKVSALDLHQTAAAAGRAVNT